MSIVKTLHDIAKTNNWWWESPLINISDPKSSKESETVYEWWKGYKKLTIYSTPVVIDYIKVWGADIDNEMEDGIIKSEADYLELWKWLSN